MQRYTLVPALVIGLMATMAHADLKLGQEIDVKFFGASGNPLWGGPHPFGGFSDYDLDGDGFSTVFVASFEIDPPKGKKFAAVMEIDFSLLPNDIEELLAYLADTPIRLEIGPIKDPGGPNTINFVESNFGSIDTDGSSIFWNETIAGDIVKNNPILIITWAQIPGPGGLALLGLAGLIGCPRRRRT